MCAIFMEAGCICIAMGIVPVITGYVVSKYGSGGIALCIAVLVTLTLMVLWFDLTFTTSVAVNSIYFTYLFFKLGLSKNWLVQKC
jgi:hypothetical protein